MIPEDVEQLELLLEKLFSSKLRDLVEQLEKDDSQYSVNIPDVDTVDLPADEVLSLVARASNNYYRVARYAGMAKAQYKIAKSRYDRIYKQNYVGNNQAEREKNAMTHAKEAQRSLGMWESISDLIQGIEAGARVASESSRKILGHITETEKGQAREGSGKFSESDFGFNRP
jgi:hypothetical protein